MKRIGYHSVKEQDKAERHKCYEELQEADHQEQEIFDCFDRFNVPCAAVTPLDTRSLLKTNNSIEV
ncbi:uncharacterized protein LOC144115479 isoform X4 [Amblyomma americanum]